MAKIMKIVEIPFHHNAMCRWYEFGKISGGLFDVRATKSFEYTWDQVLSP